MKLAGRLSRVGAQVSSALLYCSAASLLAVMAITTADVVGRYLFNSPLDGATELTEFGVALVVFCALPALTAGRGHVCVSLFERHFSPATAKWRDRLYYVLFAVGFAFIGWRSISLALRSIKRNELTEFLAFPVGWVLYAVSVLIIVAAVAALIGAFAPLANEDSENF